MASVQKNRLDKFVRQCSKKINVTIDGLRFNKLLGRLDGPKILNNSIPKSGTHLLESYLQSIPSIRNLGRKTLNDSASIKANAISLSKINAGGFVNSHLAFEPDYGKVILENNIKVLLLIRHPLDVAISRHYYIAHIDKTHFAHNYVDKDISVGINQCITGIDDVLMPLSEIYRRYSPWSLCQESLLVKYEELIGTSRGGSDVLLRTTLIRILDHLHINYSCDELDQIIFGATKITSSTLRKGVLGNRDISDYKGITDRSICSINNICHDFGYECDL